MKMASIHVRSRQQICFSFFMPPKSFSKPFLLYKAIRLHFSVCVYCIRSQKTSQRVKNNSNAIRLRLVPYTLWRHLWSIQTVRTHGKIYLLIIPHQTTSHYIILHDTIPHYSTPHNTTQHPPHRTTRHRTALAPHSTALHYTTLQYTTTLHYYTTPHHSTPHHTTLHHTTVQYTTTPHYTTLHYTTPHLVKISVR